ncbi:MMPL family transporter [Actinoalloteichus sp. AHMU CJ021]|uniref:MMPL family transporter n=1 Tax=Actinoalloteichus sp. AHMU CJ021 TaxID=2072503 RepID=UPI0026995501
MSTALDTPAPRRHPTDPAPGPLHRLGRWLAHHRRRVLWASLALTVLSGVLGATAVGSFALSRFEAPGSESDQAGRVLAERFDTGSPDLILLVTPESGDVSTAEMREYGLDLTGELADHDGVAEAYSYWTRGGANTLASRNGRHALVVARIPGDADHVRSTVLPGLTERFDRDDDLASVRIGGGEQVFRDAGAEARSDFVRAELIIFPLVFVLLVLVLRSALVALLPLAVGVLAMLVALSLLRIPLLFSEVSTFALNLTLAMGLGLGVDYGLIVIHRFREELGAGASVSEATARTLDTAGRTVVFSGVTVAASLVVLLVLPFDFLRSFAYAGVAIVAGGLVGALVVLPAVLASLGHRVAGRARTAPAPVGPEAALPGTAGRWYRAATAVMRRPVLFGGVAVVALLALGAPALGLRFGLPDDRILPPETGSRQVQEVVRSEFAAEEVDALQVVLPDAGPLAAGGPELADYAARLSEVPGVARVDSLAGSHEDGQLVATDQAEPERFAGEDATWLSAVPDLEGLEEDATGLVERVRDVPAPSEVLVGGYPAELADYRSTVVERLPLVLALILLVTFAILFLMTGSLLLPVKATVLNLLSLSVMFGALVWVFQEGNLAGALGFTATGSLEPSIPILMFCVAYGLSMDYEVFMLSRIKEEYDRTGDNDAAVAVGMQRSAPLITAAGLILAASFAAYASAGVMYIQMLGVGVAVAILVDTTLIRAVLVPAFMRLAGRANWWAPAPLRRLHDRIGLRESV